MNRSPDTLIALIFSWWVCWCCCWLSGKSCSEKGGAMRRGSLDKVFIQVAIIAAIIILLTIWIR